MAGALQPRRFGVRPLTTSFDLVGGRSRRLSEAAPNGAEVGGFFAPFHWLLGTIPKTISCLPPGSKSHPGGGGRLRERPPKAHSCTSDRRERSRRAGVPAGAQRRGVRRTWRARAATERPEGARRARSSSAEKESRHTAAAPRSESQSWKLKDLRRRGGPIGAKDPSVGALFQHAASRSATIFPALVRLTVRREG